MMNIFIMILVAIFMAGFYMLGGPAMRMETHETDYAVRQSDLRTIAQCAVAAHNATINGGEFNDICIEQNSIQSRMICLDAKRAVTECTVVRNKKPPYSFIITATTPLPTENYNDIMQILEKNYADAGTFGIFQDGVIVSGASASKRTVPVGIISDMNLENGMLVYMTQYEIPDDVSAAAPAVTDDVICPAGTVKTYRFGRWQCIGYNTKTDCGGDMIWDSELYECVPDESRKPLCASQQTAVLVDSVWECINPFPEKKCPKNMVARLNYNTLEWECVTDPNNTQNIKKCDHITHGNIYGTVGSTLRISTTSCTDCEQMITDAETCTTVCVPNPAMINDAKCYRDGANSCTGPNRAFYFGFPSQAYVARANVTGAIDVPIDANHSQNRMFNCRDCGDRGINAAKSFPPYVVVCNGD